MRNPPQHILNGWRIRDAEGKAPPAQRRTISAPKIIQNGEQLKEHIAEVESFSRAVGAKPESELPAHIRDSLIRDRSNKAKP